MRNNRHTLIMCSPGPPRQVDLEVVLLALDGDGRLTWEASRAPLGAGHPDLRALELAGHVPGALSHSTSWRHEDGDLVLTYAVVSPVSGPRATPLVEPSVVCSSDPRRPSPPVLHVHHVVAHAVRHLSDLLRRDPVVTAAMADRPALVRALHEAAAAMPVATHTQAHEMARARSAGAPRTQAPVVRQAR